MSDIRHAEAIRTLAHLVDDNRILLTTNHVISETYTLLLTRLGFRAAHQFLDRTRRSRFVQRVFVEKDWEASAEDLLLQYSDRDFSYVDATSFVTMRRLAVGETFSYGHHFEIAGFHLIR